MQPVGELDSGTIERLEKQGKLLLTIYQSELAKDPSSQGTESSRSNVIALRHTVQQIYGDAALSRLPQHIFSLPHATPGHRFGPGQ
jgi:hypothetical protein